MKVIYLAALAALGLSGCAYNVQTVSAPELNVYSNYTDKVAGKWALVIDDGGAFRQTVHAEGLACAAHSYPLDLSSTFRQSAIATFQNLVTDADVLDRPIPVEVMAAQGYSGEIEIKTDSMNVKLNFIPGLFNATADADLELDAGLVATGPKGRLVGTKASGRGHESSDAGMACGGAAIAIGNSAQKAMRDLLGEMGERFSNAPQVRPSVR
jgi:hypothetical protein